MIKIKIDKDKGVNVPAWLWGLAQPEGTLQRGVWVSQLGGELRGSLQ